MAGRIRETFAVNDREVLADNPPADRLVAPHAMTTGPVDLWVQRPLAAFIAEQAVRTAVVASAPPMTTRTTATRNGTQ